jgi:hypothetical protein
MIFDFVPGIEFDDRLKFNRIGAKLRRWQCFFAATSIRHSTLIFAQAWGTWVHFSTDRACASQESHCPSSDGKNFSTQIAVGMISSKNIIPGLLELMLNREKLLIGAGGTQM